MPEHPHIPSATYRLQFNRLFTFRDAAEIVPYLDELGIGAVYASPFYHARAGSMHGYDICDHNHLNPAVGSREDFNALSGELQQRQMGLIADFVPNHMGIGETINGWWMDVLENGPSSAFASHFDINWQPLKSELHGKVLLPILGDQYGRVLERGELKVAYQDGSFTLIYFDHVFPIAPRSYGRILSEMVSRLESSYAEEDYFDDLRSIVTAIQHLPRRDESAPELVAERAREKEVIKRRLTRLCEEIPQVRDAIDQTLFTLAGKVGQPRSFDELDALVDEQAYRLSYWKTAAEEINYRRFFDINDLAAIRVEDPEVFDAVHRLTLELIRDKQITGLRIDHVDGLLDPLDYLHKLQECYREMFLLSEGDNGLYLLVEKILMEGEQLRPEWPVHGTTGYEFTNDVVRVLTDPSAAKAFTATYAQFLDDQPKLAELIYEQKQKVMRLSLASEVNVLASKLDRLSEKNRWFRDFTRNSLNTAVREVIACFPVYRTYLMPDRETSDIDRQVIARAVRSAIRHNPGIERSIFEFLRDILLMKFPPNISEEETELHVEFVLKFQQCTGPIMAKGLEDTAFYIYNRLVALNEVGGEPQTFGATPDEFHQAVGRRAALYPHSMLATSTHDTKRSEDTRARLAAISEMPQAWRKAIGLWRTANKRHHRMIEGETAPDGNEEYLLYQTLLGTWPLGGLASEPGYISRIQEYMTKAIKEAKVNSSWIQPNEEWDDAVRSFIMKILTLGANNKFLSDFEKMAEEIAQLGMVNSLTQTVLKCMSPGMPDFYQGTELWDLSLVDPDNRRPVDFPLRRRFLQEIASEPDAAALLTEWRDGRVKLHITRTLLHLRRKRPKIFYEGNYAPLVSVGKHADSCLGFRRGFDGGEALIAIVPRLSSRVGFPPVGEAWEDTTVRWAAEDAGRWRNVLTGETRELTGGLVRVAEILRVFPVAVLERVES